MINNLAIKLTPFLIPHRGNQDWTLVSNSVKPGGNFVVLDLNPATWYNLRVTAHNNAGSTVAEYEFATLTLTGGERRLFCFTIFCFVTQTTLTRSTGFRLFILVNQDVVLDVNKRQWFVYTRRFFCCRNKICPSKEFHVYPTASACRLSIPKVPVPELHLYLIYLIKTRFLFLQVPSLQPEKRRKKIILCWLC